MRLGGLKVPENASLVACDVIDSGPDLEDVSGVIQPLKKIGKTAVMKILSLISGKSSSEKIIFKPILHKGKTCSIA